MSKFHTKLNFQKATTWLPLKSPVKKLSRKFLKIKNTKRKEMAGDSKSHSSLCYHCIFRDARDVNAKPGFDWYDDGRVAINTGWNLQHL